MRSDNLRTFSELKPEDEIFLVTIPQGSGKINVESIKYYINVPDLKEIIIFFRDPSLGIIKVPEKNVVFKMKTRGDLRYLISDPIYVSELLKKIGS